jgi:hypothetical protein
MDFKKIIPQNDKQAFWLSFFLCCFCCYTILFIISPITGLSNNFGSGNDGYIQLARNLIAGNGYVFDKDCPPVFHRPPMYPLFLVPVAIFPENLQRYIIVVPQSILVGFIGMMIFKIARKLYDNNIAAIALFLFLINPWVYWNAKNPMTAILQTFLYIVFIYLIGIELLNKSCFSQLKSSLVIAISGAALVLSHGAMLPVIFIFIFINFVLSLMRKKRVLIPVLAAIIAICLIAPWTYRNWIVFHKFIPVAGGGGLAYFNGNVHWNFMEEKPQQKNETYIDASLRIIGIPGGEQTVTQWKGFKNIENEETANAKMAEDIKTQPMLFIKKTVLNAIEYYFPMFTYPFLSVKIKSVEQIALTVFHSCLWLCAAFGFYFYRRVGLLLLVIIICYAVWYFPFATFIGHSLYTLGTIPFLSILAAAGISNILRLFP